jgi:dienelactone hydrolase
MRLRGVLFRPGGPGPQPAVVFFHGANGGTDNTVTTIGGAFVDKGYLLFFPFRRGLGPSANSGEAINSRLAREGRRTELRRGCA